MAADDHFGTDFHASRTSPGLTLVIGIHSGFQTTSTSLAPVADVRSAKMSWTTHSVSAGELEALEILEDASPPEFPGLGDVDVDDIRDADGSLILFWRCSEHDASSPLRYPLAQP